MIHNYQIYTLTVIIFYHRKLSKPEATEGKDGEAETSTSKKKKKLDDSEDEEMDNDPNNKKKRLRKDRLAKVTIERTIFVGNLSLKTKAKVRSVELYI